MGCVCGKNEVTPSLQRGSKDLQLTTHSDTLNGISRAEDLCIRPGSFIQRLAEPFSARYSILQELGSGNFGKVYKVQLRATKEVRAVKEIDKGRAEKLGGSNAKFITEVEILSRLDHPNILKIYEMLEDSRRYYIVSELCSGGELFDYITRKRKLEEPLAAAIMRQVLSAVAYCHEHGIVHRDIKPENLLLDTVPRADETPRIKLIDFGTSCLLAHNKRLNQKLGTPYYIAPEVLQANYDEKCDVWSCGVILFILLCGFPPFAGYTDEEILLKVRSGKFNFGHTVWRNVSDSAKQLVKEMLTMDTRKRPSAAQCLSSPWLQVLTAAPANQELGESLGMLQTFTRSEKLKQAFLTFITAQLLSKENEQHMADAFKRIDKNSDGKLSREELLEAYQNSMPLGQAEVVVDNIMQEVDTDGSGFIDYSEFLVACVNRESLLTQKNLKAAFEAFDRDSSGRISAQELKTMLGAGGHMDTEVWTELITQADRNGDGEIEYGEFLRLMQNSSR